MKIQDCYPQEESTLVLCAAEGLSETLSYRHALINGETYDVLSHQTYPAISGETVLAVELEGKHEFSYNDEMKLD